jgi:hypothetical protein
VSEHLIVSPKHGELRVVVEAVDPAEHYGRGFRARLVPKPPRLAHLVSTEGVTPEEAVEVMAAAVEKYGAHGAQPSRASGPSHD